MASYSRHYTLHVTASVVMVMALPAMLVQTPVHLNGLAMNA